MIFRERDTVSDVLNDTKNAATCTACQSLVGVLQAVAHLGNDAFVGVITAVLQSLGVQGEDEDVCAGAIGLEGPILAHDLRGMTIGSHTAQLFRGTIFGLCDYPAVTPYTVQFPSAKPAGAVRPPSSGKTPLKVAHYSDIHVDLSYQVGANDNCTKNICCRPYTALMLVERPNSLTSMYTAIKTLVPDAALSLFTGDVVEGTVWLVNQTEVTGDLNNAYSLIFTLGMPVYSVVGNHDVAPVNSFPPAAVDTTISSQWWIGSAAATTAEYGAYSIKNPNTNLRVISFNKNLYYEQNFWLYEKTMETDPSGQLAWLVGELDPAEKAGERVWHTGHMPMGASSAHPHKLVLLTHSPQSDLSARGVDVVVPRLAKILNWLSSPQPKKAASPASHLPNMQEKAIQDTVVFTDMNDAASFVIAALNLES
ncbi:sphingomyelin phosphodiesterase [Aureobasidium subglaciale]|nr:sphingomyelin phosphodiesterase [Aureobasidium subglaciale]